MKKILVKDLIFWAGDKVVIQEMLSKKDNFIYKVGPSLKSCQSLVRNKYCYILV